MKYFLAMLISCLLVVSADARPRKVRVVESAPFDFFAQFNTQTPPLRATTANSPSRRQTAQGLATMLPHPSGCPRRAFCGCGAAMEVFGKNVRELWLARAWFKFPRSAPGANKVAVRRGHVFVLKHHIEGSTWMVYDANSGRGKTRLHPRSIAGYTIVNPHA